MYAGAPISWKSTDQGAVALSIAEAENMALTEAANEAIQQKNIANDLGDLREQFQCNDNRTA